MVLYIIPTPLDSSYPSNQLSPRVVSICQNIFCFFAENAKSARKFLKNLAHPLPLNKIEIFEIKRNDGADIFKNLIIENKYNHVGLLSEAGCPVVADPGGAIIKYAHKHNIKVCSLPGSSTITHSLMLSGFNGQNFAFHGYLPYSSTDRIALLTRFCTRAFCDDETQIFIETPYRSYQIINFLISHKSKFNLEQNLKKDNIFNKNQRLFKQIKKSKKFIKLYLAVCANISLKNEEVMVKPIDEWNNSDANHFKGLPAVFLISYI